ncbi:hypothetical protein DPSP01_013037 [Paraphaeosphaeria sporulosa]
MLLPCVVPSGNAPSRALPSCGPVVTESSASDTPSSLPTGSITTIAADPQDPIVALPTGPDPGATSPCSAARMPAAPTPLDAAAMSRARTMLGTSTATSVPTTSQPTSTSAAESDPFSSPSPTYLPGTPPVLAALYAIVLLWTLAFGYAMYHIYRADARPRRVAAHPQWRRTVDTYGQRSPKKVGGRFEIRGVGVGGREGGVEMGGRIGRVGM